MVHVFETCFNFAGIMTIYRDRHLEDRREPKYFLHYMVRIFMGTVKFQNFQTQENFAVIYLKFKQKAQTLGFLLARLYKVQVELL